MKVLVAIIAALMAGPVQATCGHALALGLDISGSVDSREYNLQRTGLATALGAPQVRSALLENPYDPVRLLVYEWSSPTDQIIILNWTEITDNAVIDGVQDRLRRAPRSDAAQPTAIGSALLYGLSALSGQRDCPRHTLDLSADGRSNSGPRPQDVTRAYRPDGTIVNALAIQSDLSGPSTEAANLHEYLDAYVISGPGAFVEIAHGYADYAAAMERKLLRELRSLALSRLILPNRLGD